MADNKYASERFNPTFPHCGGEVKLKLKFNGKHLIMHGQKSMHIYPAISGSPNSKVAVQTAPSNLGRRDRIAKSIADMLEKNDKAKKGIIDYSLFDYSKYRQKLHDIGPIPTGIYWINPAEISPAGLFRRRFQYSSYGDYRITIHPFTGTETYNRGGFFIHGGSSFGTKGCIDLAYHMNRFIEDLKKEIDETFMKAGCQIHLFVEYPFSQVQCGAYPK